MKVYSYNKKYQILALMFPIIVTFLSPLIQSYSFICVCSNSSQYLTSTLIMLTSTPLPPPEPTPRPEPEPTEPLPPPERTPTPYDLTYSSFNDNLVIF
jgi:hypothetical protein